MARDREPSLTKKMSEPQRPKTLRDSIESAKQQELARRLGVLDRGPFEWLAWAGRISILLVSVVPPWLIGSVHASSQWMISITLLIGLAIWWIELAVAKRQPQILPHVLLFVLAGCLIGLIQTTSLPQSVLSLIAGRQIDLYQQTLGPVVAPGVVPKTFLSMDVEATWQQLRLLLLAAISLILGCQFFRRPLETVVLLSVVTVNGVALSLFGIVQKLTFNGKLYWQIELTQGGMPFGPFVNRNNCSGYLLMCLAAAIGLLVYLWPQSNKSGAGIIVSREIPFWRQIHEHIQLSLAELTATKLAVLFAIVIIAAGVVSSLSRGGVSAMMAAAIITLLFFGMARKPRAGTLLIFPLLAGVVLLTSWVGFYDKLLERFDEINKITNIREDDGRIRTWSESSASVGEMGVFGSGLGSYPAIHRMYSSMPEKGIFEYAENQYVQSLIDAGVPGFSLLLGATIFFVYAVLFVLYRGASPISVSIGAMGVFLTSSQIIASVFDFGWYIPANTMLLSVLVGAISQHIHSFSGRLKKKNFLRFRFPAMMTYVISLVMFCLCLMTCFSLNRQAQNDKLLTKNIDNLSFDHNLEATEKSIQILNQSVSNFPSSKYLNHLGKLWLHRSRLLMFDTLVQGLPIDQYAADDREKLEERLWKLTDLTRLHEQLSYLRTEKGASFVNEFRQEPFMSESLLPVARFFSESLRYRPLQPEVAVKLGQIMSLMGNPEKGKSMIDQAIMMSPNNVGFHVTASLSSLFDGDFDSSIPHLRRILELDPSQFVRVISLIQGLTGRILYPISNEIIAEKVLPENPMLIYDFVVKFLPPDSELKKPLLNRAFELVGKIPQTDSRVVLLKANILLENDDIENGISQLEIATVNNPSDQPTRYRLAKLLMTTGRLDEAMRHAKRLLDQSESSKMYQTLVKEIQTEVDKKRFFPDKE